jgi:DnaK suppressor protein
MDVFDQAQEHDELFRQEALNRHFANWMNTVNPSGRPKPGPHSIEAEPGGGQRACCDCGDEIEPERLKALPYAVRCVGCQGKKERKERLHG